MRTVAQVVGIGAVATFGSVTIALFGAPELVRDEATLAAAGLASLDVGLLACDASLPPEGPAPDALNERLRAATPRVMPCLPPSSDPPRETLGLQLTIDCSGALVDVAVARAGDWPSDVVECFADALEHARFPAHGRLDGYTFDFPVRYTAHR